MRCPLQLSGPSRDILHYAKAVLERELDSSNDNPLICAEYDTFIHNGHFQGQYISHAMDNVAMAMTTISVISDCRIDRFLDAGNGVGLPSFLCRKKTGVCMGLMGGQFMTTSIVAENRTRCLPASVQSIASTSDFQDVTLD